MSRRLILACAILMWTVTIGYVPAKAITEFDGWGGFQTATVGMAVTLTLMWWLNHEGAEYKVGFRNGYQRALRDKRNPRS